MNRLWVRITLIIFLFLAALADVFTTFRNHALLTVESNPLAGGADFIIIMLCLKFLMIIGISYLLLWKAPFNNTPTKQFFYINMTLILIILQFGAAVNNHLISHAIKDDYGYERISQITSEDMKPYDMPKEEKTKAYFSRVIPAVIGPLIISMLSFVIWRNVYRREYDDSS